MNAILFVRTKSGTCHLLLFVFIVFLSACSSSNYMIKSNPEGAEVSSLQGDLIGRTPLELSEEQAKKISDGAILNFKISANGYIPRVVMVGLSEVREVSLNLPKSESKSFKAEFSKDFTGDLNRMFREGFDIQRLLAGRKIVEATEAVSKFKTAYPQIAFGYVIAAHIALMEGKKEEAKRNLLRARSLDPDDPSIMQSIKLLGPTQLDSSPPSKESRP